MHRVENQYNAMLKLAMVFVYLFCVSSTVFSQAKFKVLAFCPPTDDGGHVSFMHEANKWFPSVAAQNNFTYDSTKTWSDCNATKLAQYQVVMFLDNRPDDATQRQAFQKYMENGGGWIGFHFAAFALNNSAVPQNWDWYHKTFLGSDQYSRNTWAPTTAILRVEDTTYPSTKGLPAKFTAQPNEWYAWSADLRTNAAIKILCSIDPSAFPVGTGTGAGGASEIWTSGYYPVVWTNKNFRMLYVNMGHNDNSLTFGSATQNKMILNTLAWLGGTTAAHPGTTVRANTVMAVSMDIREDGRNLIVSGTGCSGFEASIFDLQGHSIVQGRTSDRTISFDKGKLKQNLYVVRLQSSAGTASRLFSAAGQ
jgi:uncharacterized protein